MAGALAVAGAGWGISAAGWLISPVMSKLVNDGYSYLEFDAPQKLRELEVFVVPQLRRMMELADRSPHKALLEGWVTELKSAYYDAEDILDVADYHLLEKQVLSQTSIDLGFRGTLKKRFRGTLKKIFHYKLKKRLDRLEKIINAGRNFLQLFNLPSNIRDGNTSSPHDAANSVLPTTSIPPPRVFGREDVVLKIRGILRDTEMAGNGEPSSSSTTCYSVIGIYGITGSGKTTVAQCVCDEEKDGYFHPVMWIHVSQNFSVHAILKEMFEAASNETRPEFTNLDMIQRSLELKLRGKRFLLVLDDIWCANTFSLEQILSPLRVGRRGSKILVTTQMAEAARSLGALSPIPLPELDEEGFFKFFMHYATNGARFDEQQQETFETIGRQIIRKLKRSPLAAKMVARTLSKNLDVGFWRRARDKDLLADSIMGALWWSYQHLDDEVRRCFAYCSIFPRRHLLKRDELVNLWMAEGFIKISNAGEQIEDIGQRYFHELVSRSFLQQTGRVGDSDTVCFTIHDLLYDLAKRVAGSDCFTVLESNVEIPPTVRHLCINSYNAMEIAEQICKLENLRTLIYTNYIGHGITERVLDGMLNKLRRLRVVQVRLDSEDNNLIAIPGSVGNLKHLRCLSIYNKQLPVVDLCLPSTFDKLYHLQILEYPSINNLRCSCVRSINNLINLRHVKSSSTLDLFDDDNAALEIPGIGRLKSLQTLGCFGVRKEKGYELQQLEGLNHLQGILRISGLGNVESKEQALEAKLADKEGLTSLALGYVGTDECPPDVQADILEGLRPPSSVTQLRIHGYHSRRYPSWLSGNQNAPRNLQRLQLKCCHELEDLPEIGEIFIHLHELRLECLRSLKSLPTLPENLKKLVIECCTSLAFICMEDVEMLRTMFVERASQADPSLKSVNPEGIAGFSPEQFDRFKATLYDYDFIGESGSSLSYSRSSYNLTLENVFPLVRGNCEEDSQLLIPGSVEHLSIGFCTITDSALRNCLIGCTSITCLELSGILCLTAIPWEFLTRLRELSITACVDLTILHGLNDLRNLENLTIKKCPNLKALQDSEKVGALCSLTVDDLSLVPELLSTEGRSSLTELRIYHSKERTEAAFLQQLTSLIFLEFWDCDWDTLPENLVHLASLKILLIYKCEKIQSLPVLPESLEYFALDACDPDFMDSCQTHGDPNWQKIRHVPRKIIADRRWGNGCCIGRIF